jgi:hypothetical protein
MHHLEAAKDENRRNAGGNVIYKRTEVKVQVMDARDATEKWDAL